MCNLSFQNVITGDNWPHRMKLKPPSNGNPKKNHCNYSPWMKNRRNDLSRFLWWHTLLTALLFIGAFMQQDISIGPTLLAWITAMRHYREYRRENVQWDLLACHSQNWKRHWQWRPSSNFLEGMMYPLCAKLTMIKFILLFCQLCRVYRFCI